MSTCHECWSTLSTQNMKQNNLKAGHTKRQFGTKPFIVSHIHHVFSLSTIQMAPATHVLEFFSLFCFTSPTFHHCVALTPFIKVLKGTTTPSFRTGRPFVNLIIYSRLKLEQIGETLVNLTLTLFDPKLQV